MSERQSGDPREQDQRDDLIEEATEESFPASDPPSWTPERSGSPSQRPDHPVGDGGAERQADGASGNDSGR